jgi:hypothetical protein
MAELPESVEDEGIITYAHKIQEFMRISEFMDDDQIDIALGYVVKLSEKPDVPSSRVPNLIVRLEALAADMHMKGTLYKTVGAGRSGSPEAHKKNLYLSMTAALERLVDALKYYKK